MLPVYTTFPSTELQSSAASLLAARLQNHLHAGSVFLLLSGGSAITMYKVMVGHLLESKVSLTGLVVSLFDERYVPLNHPDSNQLQLEESGVIHDLVSSGATWIPYLQADDTDGERVAMRVENTFKEILASHPTVVVFAGLGEDGHTAGLLPTSDQMVIDRVFNTPHLLAYYDLPTDTKNPYRQRLTTTPAFIAHVNEAYVYAAGEKKRSALTRFIDGSEPVTICPALALYASTSPVTILTDVIHAK